VATSNVAPQDLYKEGLNRALFLPSIALIEAHMDVVRLDARQDFRLTKLSHAGTWFVPDDARARASLDRLFLDLTGMRDGRPMSLSLLGRSIAVPHAAAGVARFTFKDLFDQPLGAADFLMVAQAFHTVMIDGIRIITAAERNVAKRFITAIDAFYDGGVKLIASAADQPQNLYDAEEGREVFEFQRTVSRLIEMRSDSYLALAHHGASSGRSGDTGGLVET
jgi:cell division protein ZapE